MKPQPIESTLVNASAVRVPARAPAWVVPSIKLALLITDLLLAAATFAGAYYLRIGGALYQNSAWSQGFAPYGVLLVLVLPIRLLALGYYDLYRLRGEFSFVDDGIKVFKATAVGSLLIVAAAFLYRGGFAHRAFSYARGVFILDFVLAAGAYLLLRFAMRGVQVLARR